ncbi:ABSCISIC ACID-INSENSITIVE 5 5 [Olea europaea subsp. europaea]|uniref:ABSCISIC ACID-INSENSITIVE 5 5 n=1 Tax=Olea europaea subsp. europaea TaxID=158383 RepID=A0A8S0SAL3_OLEEU|nr:ABSCISIC ACID-INSENSITIVE 5 5 [Olea europaea subsp. europaea]
MGSNLNFKNLGNDSLEEGIGAGRLPNSFSLTRQPSVYSLTFDEFQSNMGSFGKVGSMNMDELLKNIWSAEENQNIGSSNGGSGGGGGQEGGGNLQRQGSLTLPRTLSQKTVEEVWKDLSKEYGVGKDGSGSVDGLSTMSQREPTLGEITLEDFLVKAGVVREDTHLSGKPNDIGFFGNLAFAGNNLVPGFGYQNAGGNVGVMDNRIPENSNEAAVRSIAHSQQSQQQQQPLQQQKLLPKRPVLPSRSPLGLSNGDQFGGTTIRGGIGSVSNSGMNNNLVQSATLQGGGLGMVGLGPGVGGVATGSPVISADGLAKSNGDVSSVSPVPYMFNGGLRGRRSGPLEKVVERRQKRMIKNRESAARSRARKQAYTMELEAEVANLKEDNQELRKKLEGMMKMQRNQVQEMMNQKHGSKRRCLRRTQTGPW